MATDHNTLWLVAAALLVTLPVLHISFSRRAQGYDLEQYLLAGRKLTNREYALAIATLTLLGPLLLSHVGLLQRSGLSYGFVMLACVIGPAMGTLVTGRLARLARPYGVLTPAEMLGGYFQSTLLRRLVVLVALVIAFCLISLTLRLGGDLLAAFASSAANNADAWQHAGPRTAQLPAMGLMALLLYINAAEGGMGAVLRVAAATAVMTALALTVAALLADDAAGGLIEALQRLETLSGSAAIAPLFTLGPFFDPIPAAAPANMPWPGTMATSALIAGAGLFLTPAVLMAAFAADRQSAHAAQPFGLSLLAGPLLLIAPPLLAFLPLLLAVPDGSAATLTAVPAGNEIQTLFRTLGSTPTGSPAIAAFLGTGLVSASFAAAAAALLAAGAMFARDLAPHGTRTAQPGRPLRRRARLPIVMLIAAALAHALMGPADALTLFLLAGAFGLQLLPALLGIAYFPSLTPRAVTGGLVTGLLATAATSLPAQAVAAVLGIPMPYDAWPLGLHPAVWGLAANLAALLLLRMTEFSAQGAQAREHAFRYRAGGSRLAAAAAMMEKAPDRLDSLDRPIAYGLVLVLAATVILPLTGVAPLRHELIPLSSVWVWQARAWFAGLILVFVLAYRLQRYADQPDTSDNLSHTGKVRLRVRAVLGPRMNDAIAPSVVPRGQATSPIERQNGPA